MSTKKTIVVTGGLGYIGSHTVVELLESGFEVIVVDNLVNSRIEVLENIYQITGVLPKFYEIDLLDRESLEHVFETHSIDAVIHFAAYKSVGESQKKALAYYLNNINSLTVLLKCMEDFKVENIIFSSSCTVYGAAKNNPVNENESVKNAESVYGKTKIICEQIIQDVCNSEFSLKSIVLRYFNPVGAHSSGLIGENLLTPPSNLFPIILETLSGEREHLEVFGNDYNTADQTAIRDYIHVVDLAKAHLSALNYLFNQVFKIDFFNIGTGKGYSVLEIISQFEKTLNTRLAFKYSARREGDIEQIWADSSKAKEKLNWEAELNLQDMVESALKRMKNTY